MLTNRLGLPAPIENALRRQRYSRGDARKSVTQLIDSPRVDILRRQHIHEITEDVADRLWALFGTALHSVLELGASDQHIPEERLFAEIEGWRVSGGIDLQILDEARGAVGLRDYKFTSVWSVIHPKRAWTQQLNCYAWLVRTAKGYVVEDAEIIAILRDWNRAEAGRKNDYPQTPIIRVPVELWPEAEATAYVASRVRVHMDAERALQWGDPLPQCSDDERWARPAKWAVKKPGQKRALRVFDREADAIDFQSEDADTEIEARPGKDTRCEGNFCQVAEWCDRMRKSP